jgi:hypothetical protein
MNPVYSIDARKALWTGTRVQLHVQCRAQTAKNLKPWRGSPELRTNYVHEHWMASSGDSIRTYVGFLKEWAQVD